MGFSYNGQLTHFFSSLHLLHVSASSVLANIGASIGSQSFHQGCLRFQSHHWDMTREKRERRVFWIQRNQLRCELEALLLEKFRRKVLISSRTPRRQTPLTVFQSISEGGAIGVNQFLVHDSSSVVQQAFWVDLRVFSTASKEDLLCCWIVHTRYIFSSVSEDLPYDDYFFSSYMTNEVTHPRHDWLC